MWILDALDKSVNMLVASLPRSIPSQHVLKKARLIAHRGAHCANYIENTDRAFAKAQALGCWGIEFDVHATADNVIVVNHDPTLNRLWGVNAAINSLTFNALREQAPEVPSLAEIVACYGRRMHLFIELKAPFTAEEALFKTLQPLTPEKDYHLITLDEEVFAPLSKFPRAAMLLVAGHNNAAHQCQLSLQKSYGGVLGHYLLLTATKVAKLHAAQQKTGVGFVDSKFSLYRELNRGMQWIISNNVQRVSQYLRALQE